MKNLLLVLSGPSGVGKGTVVRKLIGRGKYALSVSCTTRTPREQEEDGVSYFFISKEKFESMISDGGFLEYSRHFGNYYGTPRAFVEEKLESGNVILEIEVDGALQVKKAYPEAVLIMILPPDESALRSRLKGRGTETADKIEERIKRMQYEVSKKDSYDYVVINEYIDTAVEEIESIISKEQNK